VHVVDEVGGGAVGVGDFGEGRGGVCGESAGACGGGGWVLVGLGLLFFLNEGKEGGVTFLFISNWSDTNRCSRCQGGG